MDDHAKISRFMSAASRETKLNHEFPVASQQVSYVVITVSVQNIQKKKKNRGPHISSPDISSMVFHPRIFHPLLAFSSSHFHLLYFHPGFFIPGIFIPSIFIPKFLDLEKEVLSA